MVKCKDCRKEIEGVDIKPFYYFDEDGIEHSALLCTECYIGDELH